MPTIRPYRAGDETGIVALFNEVFSEGNPSFRPRTLEHWHWQFRDNPLGHQTFVADDFGAIVGTYTAIPGRWIHDGRPMQGAQAVDTCVKAQYRQVLKREGLFLQLAGAWFDHYGVPERDEIVYGFPNPIAFRIGTRQLDYRPVHTPVIALVRDFGRDWIDYLPGMGGAAIGVREVHEVPEDADALFAATLAKQPLVQRRDAAYLHWRYLDCPKIAYRMFAARGSDGTLRGIAVVRPKWIDVPGTPISPVLEWIADGRDQEALAGLARAVAIAGEEAGRARLETWLPPWSAHAATLRTLGFAPDPSHFNLCIRVFGPPFDERWAADHWFYSMGDSDIY